MPNHNRSATGAQVLHQLTGNPQGKGWGNLVITNVNLAGVPTLAQLQAQAKQTGKRPGAAHCSRTCLHNVKPGLTTLSQYAAMAAHPTNGPLVAMGHKQPAKGGGWQAKSKPSTNHITALLQAGIVQLATQASLAAAPSSTKPAAKGATKGKANKAA